jgi:nucleotide-binding universal stress UspA family protein
MKFNQGDSVMFKHILVPLDGSSTSEAAIAKAVAMAKAFNSSITLLSVVDIYAFAGLGIDVASGQTDYLSAATAEAKLAVHSAVQLCAAEGVSVMPSVVEGQGVYKSILAAADACGADLIVMGSHGRKGLEKLVLGSVASQVLAHTHLPVMIIRQ